MSESFIRKPSANELLYMDIQDYLCPITCRCVLEISRSPNIQLLNDTLEKLLEIHYGYNVYYKKGKFYKSNNMPKFTLSEIAYDNLNEPTVAIDYYDHTLEVFAYHTDNDRYFLVFDFFHGVTDGHGAIRFIYDFFSKLQGNEVQKLNFSKCDIDVVKRHNYRKTKIPIDKKSELKRDFILDKICEDAHPKRFTFKSNGMAAVARASIIVASFFEKEKSVIMVPTDIRSYSGEKSFLGGNISLPLYLQLKGNEKPIELFLSILDRIKNGEALNINSANFFGYSSVPDFIRKPMFCIVVKFLKHSKNFTFASLISNIGRIDDEKLKNPCFDVTDFYMQAGCSPIAAFTIVMSSYRGIFSLGVGWNTSKVSKELAENVTNKLKTEFMQ